MQPPTPPDFPELDGKTDEEKHKIVSEAALRSYWFLKHVKQGMKDKKISPHELVALFDSGLWGLND